MPPIPPDRQLEIIGRIRHLQALMELSQSRFAERMGISAANMSKHLSGKLPITPGLVNRICLDYGVSREWLLNGSDVPFAKRECDRLKTTDGHLAERGVPVYDIDVTAGFGPLDRMFTSDRISGYIDLPQLGNPQNERIVRVSGDSMEPRIADGCYIAIREIQSDTIFWGQAYVVILEDYRMVKILRRHADPSKVILHSENPDYDDLEVERDRIIGIYLVDAVINCKAT